MSPLLLWCFLIFKLNMIQSQEPTTLPPATPAQTQTPNLTESPAVPAQSDVSEDEDGPDETSLSDDGPVPEIILDSITGTNIPHYHTVKHKFYYKPLPIDVLHKFSVLHRWRPVQEKLDRLKEFLVYTKHPNYGGVQLLSPQEIWERLHEKGHHFLTGVQGAVFGLANVENLDYPFAYRHLGLEGQSDKIPESVHRNVELQEN